MDQDISMFDDVYGDDDDMNALFGDGSLDDEFSQDADMSANGFPAPEAIPKDQDVENAELSNLLQEGMTGDGEGLDINALNDRELEIGDKADDAMDYADIDDDDLAEEEDPVGGPVQPMSTPFLSGIEDSAIGNIDDDDDLFGPDEDYNASFTEPALGDSKSDNAQQREDATSVASDQAGDEARDGTGTLAALGERDDAMTEEEQRNYRLQLALLSGQAGEQADPFGIDDMDMWLKLQFPDFDRNDETPFWNQIIPPKLGKWQGKEPKKPRPIRPTKVTLDIEQDQKTLFTTPANLATPFEPRSDLIFISSEQTKDQLESIDLDSDSDDELPNGLTMQDLEFMCTDFDTLSNVADEDAHAIPEPRIVGEDVDMFELEDEYNDYDHPIKKRRTGLSAGDIVKIHQFDLPSFDDPEKMTARLARDVVLDLNDSRLLVEEVDQENARQRSKVGGDKPGQTTSVKERLAQRFKTSNDAAYNLLQQNQKKVRGQLSNMTIDHSIPAIRLQYPYFQVKLTQKEARNWHRKHMLFKGGIAFSKIAKQKRKDYKLKPVREAYGRTRDLSVADNSYALLLEYSEEHPIMISQTGMGNKIVNYYRKLDSNDPARPKSEIGDTSVLMPEDKSPFNNFGHIDPGESTLALYNSMYRAPIFKQTQAPQDFLVVREVTGMNGQIHYLRNIDYQYVVGQELPSVTVPGTHSRMVTTASKNRLKAISFRIARRKKSHRIRVEEVTRHFPDTNDMQNRQKMKEFMAFNKEQKEWEMRDGAPIPDEDEVQKSLIPEDISLLESMQVGSQYLYDAGFQEEDDDDDDDNDKKELTVEQQLAPWKTTKNFIQATQGKAMLKLYGEGDPSGRGEAFSFLKTSMKGGFRAQGLSTNENVDKQRGKSEHATGGHTYNVARQQKSYDDSIRAIWDKQKAVLSSQIEPEDIEDEGVDGQLDDMRSRHPRATPMSGVQTPGVGRRRDDETGTSFSKRSMTSQAQQFLRITRRIYNARDDAWEMKEIIESDPAVIKLYKKRKEQLEANNFKYVPSFCHNYFANIYSAANFVPTGDPETDARNKKRYHLSYTFVMTWRLTIHQNRRTNRPHRVLPNRQETPPTKIKERCSSQRGRFTRCRCWLS